MVLHGDHASGLEVDFRDADTVFDEQDFFGATVEDVEAAVFVGVAGIPVRGRVAKFVVLQKFDGDVPEGLRREIAEDVGEGGGHEADVAVGQRERYWRFAFDGVDDLGGAESNEDVVVAVIVHESLRVRRDVDVEDADLIVDECLMMVGLGGDFHVGGRLRGEEGSEKQEQEPAGHELDCSGSGSQESGNAALHFLTPDY